MSVAQSSVSNLVLCELHPHSVQGEYCFCVGALQCIVVSVLVHCGLKLSEYGWRFCSTLGHAGLAAF